MEPNEKRALAQLMRRFVRLLADRRALMTLLKETESEGIISDAWRDRFEQLQQTPEYSAILEAYEPMILRLEEGADLDEVMPLFQKISEGKLPN